MALKNENLLILIFSVLFGAIIGETANIDGLFNRFAALLKTTIKFKDENFSEGFVTASLIFGIGPMLLLGAIEDGLNSNYSILYTKSVLDGFTSIALASALGIGVIFSAVTVLILQGGITMAAAYSKAFFTAHIINEISAVGGILLMALGLHMLEVKEIKVANLLPSLVVALILAYLFS